MLVGILGENIASRLIVLYHMLEGEHIYRVKCQKKMKTSFWGSKMDGGFAVVPKKLGKKPLIFTFGIGENLTFSEAAYRETQAEIWAFDPTPCSIDFIQKSELMINGNIQFMPVGLADKDGEMDFFLPIDSDRVDNSASAFLHSKTKEQTITVPVRSFTSIVRQVEEKRGKQIDTIDIVKMDIEGSEFGVLHDMINSEVIDKVGQICVEVHPRFFEDGQERLDSLVNEMNQKDFYIVYTSPDKLVLTFYRE